MHANLPMGAASTVRDLRWSLFTVGDNVEGAHRRSARPAEMLGYVEEAERLGYWAFFFAEHHFDAHGEVPDPWLMVAAAAERTRNGRLRVGPMVTNLAFRHPIQVAEQALLANALSGDRVEVGVGSGNIPQEHVAFGLHPDPVARKRAAFEAAIPTFLATLSGRDLPIPELPAGQVRVDIGPPIASPGRVWFAVGNAEAGTRFAAQGHSVALGPPFATMPDLATLGTMVSRIRAGGPSSTRPRIAAAFPTYVGPHAEAALAALDAFVAQKNHDGKAHLPEGARGNGHASSAEELVQRNLALIGTPEEVQAQLSEVAATGITDLFAMPDFGGLAPEYVVPSLRAIARMAGLAGSDAALGRLAASPARATAF